MLQSASRTDDRICAYVKMVFMPDDNNMSPDNSKRKPIPIYDIRARALERSKQIALQVNRSFQPGQANDPTGPTLPKPKKKMMPAFWYRLSRKGRILVSLAVVLILAAASLAVYTNFISKEKGAAGTAAAVKKEAPTTMASPLTGVQVAPELANRPVTAVMIENSLDARPQSGLADAGIVFEAIAEGGITRFLALFQETTPQYVGPVRSIRPYYLDFGAPFGAGFAHVGGSPEALAQVRNTLRDLDQFLNPGSYWRVSSRVSPHNVYTSFAKLDTLNTAKGYGATNFTSLPRKSGKPAATVTARTIDLLISSGAFYVHYDYDATTNTYMRNEGGAPHYSTSAENESPGVQLRPKVVIALTMPFGIVDEDGHGGYGTVGKDEAFIFQNGEFIKGYWVKDSQHSQFKFVDATGATIYLEPGQTWITIVQADQVRVGL